MTNAPLMPKATAVWLVENTALSFDQIADFCKLHPLEVKAVADGDAAQGIKGLDPLQTGQLTREEIAKGEADPNYRLQLLTAKVRLPEAGRKKATAVLAEMKSGGFSIFKGPLKDNTGKEVIAKGTAYKQTEPKLEEMNYLVEGVAGKI